MGTSPDSSEILERISASVNGLNPSSDVASEEDGLDELDEPLFFLEEFPLPFAILRFLLSVVDDIFHLFNFDDICCISTVLPCFPVNVLPCFRQYYVPVAVL